MSNDEILMTKECSNDPRTNGTHSSPTRALRISFCALVALLAVFQFSENTADPDLWGHIVYGRQILLTGIIPK